MSAGVQPNDFGEFCEFVVRMRDAGTSHLTPEKSVEEFRKEQEKLRVWQERNALSQQQAELGEFKPLDLDGVMGRVKERLAARGIAD
jgi:hypothetical protein